MILARTLKGYKPTFNIKKGDVLLNNGEWIEAEQDSTELPCYQVTFDDNTYTFVKNESIVPKSCNLPITYDNKSNADFVKGYCIQNKIKFPYKFRDHNVLVGFIALNKKIPPFVNDLYTVKEANLSYDYSFDSIANLINGIMYKNLDVQGSKRTVRLNRPLNDEGVFLFHLASVSAKNTYVSEHTYINLFSILYSANPTEWMITKGFRLQTNNYTNDKVIVNITPSIFYGLPNQNFDINNFSTI